MKRNQNRQARAKTLRAKFIDEDTVQLTVTDLIKGDVTVFTFSLRALSTAKTLQEVLESATLTSGDVNNTEVEEAVEDGE